tara:strand:- start:1597 stop:2169 length:573 start_codon:yes stop_codon:yes gene_type:complete
MSISRRNFLLGTVSTLALTTLVSNGPKANIKVATAPGDREMIATMCRALYPHDRFPDKIYLDVADGAIKKGNASPGSAMMMRTGLNDLKDKSFNKMSFGKQTKYLKKIEGSPFFNHVRGHTTVALYDHKEVWKIFGYEGESFSKGGYIKRGFNDLDWLPEPRVTEHPDLAKFMGTDKSQYANIKPTTKVN